jgi:hypothetical protein
LDAARRGIHRSSQRAQGSSLTSNGSKFFPERC